MQSFLEGVLSPHVFRDPGFFYPVAPPCSHHDSQGCPHHLQASQLEGKMHESHESGGQTSQAWKQQMLLLTFYWSELTHGHV